MSGAPADPHGAPAPENPDVRFERVDADPAVVVKWGIGLGLMTIVCAAIAVWLLVWLRRREEAGDPGRPALYFSTEQRQPEGVRLQSAPFQDLHHLRDEERRILDTYGWVDEPAGVVHIPITRAMTLYMERQAGSVAAASRGPSDTGLPTDSAPVPSPLAVTTSPSPIADASPATPAPPAPGSAGGPR
jgi:hypothetical protein